jgi:LCP family protein required for cell wall assembly
VSTLRAIRSVGPDQGRHGDLGGGSFADSVPSTLVGMSERPPGDGKKPTADDRFSWLYGSNPPADPDATQAIQRPAQPPPTPDSDRTQALGSGGPPPQSARPAEPLPPMNLPPPGRTQAEDPWQPPPMKPPKKKRRWWLRIILALILIWILFLIIVPIWAWSKIDKVDAEPSGDRPSDQPGTTYLVVGSDSREGLSKEEGKELGTGGPEVAGGQRTDTIMLLHVGDGQPLLLSIPRDSLVTIPGVGEDQKVNAAFSLGGPKLLVKTLENETGIRIDDYVEIGFGGFVNIVDSVGGIEVCPDEAIDDKKASLDIDAGCQDVDGTTALGYARTRHFSTGDIQRGQNQREVIGQIGDKAASPWTILNPLRYWNVAMSGGSSLTIGDNVGPLSLARFAWNMAHVTSGGGLSCTVPIADLAVNWDDDRANELFDYIIQDNTDDVPKSLCTKDGLEH